MRQKILYALLALTFLALSFWSGKLTTQIEASKEPQAICPVEDTDSQETVSQMLDLLKEVPPELQKETVAVVANPSTPPAETSTEGAYVASKSSSSKKFHEANSANGKRIKPENRIYFKTKEEALAAGYTPGSGVK